MLARLLLIVIFLIMMLMCCSQILFVYVVLYVFHGFLMISHNCCLCDMSTTRKFFRLSHKFRLGRLTLQIMLAFFYINPPSGSFHHLCLCIYCKTSLQSFRTERMAESIEKCSSRRSLPKLGIYILSKVSPLQGLQTVELSIGPAPDYGFHMTFNNVQ